MSPGELTRGQYLRRRQIILGVKKHRWETVMRYRIQIETLLDCVVIVVTEIRGDHEYVSHTRKMYTMDGEAAHHGGLPEVLAFLQEQVASTTP